MTDQFSTHSFARAAYCDYYIASRLFRDLSSKLVICIKIVFSQAAKWVKFTRPATTPVGNERRAGFLWLILLAHRRPWFKNLLAKLSKTYRDWNGHFFCLVFFLRPVGWWSSIRVQSRVSRRITDENLSNQTGEKYFHPPPFRIRNSHHSYHRTSRFIQL